MLFNKKGIVQNVALLFVCVGFLVVQPDKVSGALTSIDLVLRGHPLFPGRSSDLEAVKLSDVRLMPSLAPVPSVSFDPNQSSKRRAGKGSDPIHNRILPTH